MRKDIVRNHKTIVPKLSILSACIFILCSMTSCGKAGSGPEVNTSPETENSLGAVPIQASTSDIVMAETDPDLPVDASAAESAAESAEESLAASKAPAQIDTPDLEGWKLAYFEYLNTLESNASFTYSLIYVDEDDIPELVIDTGYEAGGCMLLTWHNNRLDTLQTSRLYFNYIEKGSLLCNQEGNMGYYYDDVYTIQDGKWVYLCGGTYHDSANDAQVDEEGNFIYEYEWNEETVSEADYKEKLNAAYPLEQSIEPEKYYILDEILSVLKTGDVASAGHRYELVVEDLTWTEAVAACEAKGGYLATITSFEEWERITEQIASEEKNNITFFVGARDICWLEPGIEGGYPMLALYNALFQFWLEGEPSYRGFREDGVEVNEEYVVLLYRKSDGKYYLNDVPDNILAAAPSYAGKVGYICEYNE
ncbi:MAG: C-type lectin domain-containing protein [Lachnospiraceae bacterium]|nr:C-type lectin domain-containing protein [Lachnospiraceae bacterium]